MLEEEEQLEQLSKLRALMLSPSPLPLVTVYFCDFKPSVLIDPLTLSSPKLDRLGFTKPAEWERITGEQWDDVKGKSFGKSKINDREGDEPNELLIYGRLAERWHQLGK